MQGMAVWLEFTPAVNDSGAQTRMEHGMQERARSYAAFLRVFGITKRKVIVCVLSWSWDGADSAGSGTLKPLV